MPGVRVIGDHVGRIGGHGNRCREQQPPATRTPFISCKRPRWTEACRRGSINCPRVAPCWRCFYRSVLP